MNRFIELNRAKDGSAPILVALRAIAFVLPNDPEDSNGSVISFNGLPEDTIEVSEDFQTVVDKINEAQNG
jgi:hypothetical protein